MLQIELYVSDVEKTAGLLVSVFGFKVTLEKPGFMQLRHPEQYDVMLFNPTENAET